MSNISHQNGPARGSGENVLDAPIPYVVLALLRVVDEGLNMPEPEFDPDEEGVYLTSVARRMDTMREHLAEIIGCPSLNSAAKTVDEMSRWLTAQHLKYRPLVHDETASKNLEPSAV
jgi:hypothetical protein